MGGKPRSRAWEANRGRYSRSTASSWTRSTQRRHYAKSNTFNSASAPTPTKRSSRCSSSRAHGRTRRTRRNRRR
eukprot:7821308-Pyramimonas_sp.AAC.1